MATARELDEQQGWDAVVTRRRAERTERVENSPPVLYSPFHGRREIIGVVALEGASRTALFRPDSGQRPARRTGWGYDEGPDCMSDPSVGSGDRI